MMWSQLARTSASGHAPPTVHCSSDELARQLRGPLCTYLVFDVRARRGYTVPPSTPYAGLRSSSSAHRRHDMAVARCCTMAAAPRLALLWAGPRLVTNRIARDDRGMVP